MKTGAAAPVTRSSTPCSVGLLLVALLVFVLHVLLVAVGGRVGVFRGVQAKTDEGERIARRGADFGRVLSDAGAEDERVDPAHTLRYQIEKRRGQVEGGSAGGSAGGTADAG